MLLKLDVSLCVFAIQISFSVNCLLNPFSIFLGLFVKIACVFQRIIHLLVLNIENNFILFPAHLSFCLYCCWWHIGTVLESTKYFCIKICVFEALFKKMFTFYHKRVLLHLKTIFAVSSFIFGSLMHLEILLHIIEVRDLIYFPPCSDFQITSILFKNLLFSYCFFGNILSYVSIDT